MKTPQLFLLPILLFSFLAELSAQDTLYFTKFDYPTEKLEDARYFGFLEKEGRRFVLTTFFRSNGSKRGEGAFDSKKMKSKEGEWIYFFENGNKEEVVNFLENSKIGPYQSWHKNGNLSEQGKFEDGWRIGEWERWYEDGTKRGSFEYEKKFYFPRVKELWLENGVQSVAAGEGKYISYIGVSDELQVVGSIKNQKREGEWKFFRAHGDMYENLFFKDGKAEGKNTRYHENGEMAAVGNYEKGLPVGLWQFFDSTGEVIYVKNYAEQPEMVYEGGHEMGSSVPMPTNIGLIKRAIGYPNQALRSGWQDQVVVRVLVGKEGQYLKHRVVNFKKYVFVKAIEKHIEHIRFVPAFQGGKVVKFWVNIPFNFKLLN
ncbi:MAG: energy transducer TonB [Bacteroidota bacterium]